MKTIFAVEPTFLNVLLCEHCRDRGGCDVVAGCHSVAELAAALRQHPADCLLMTPDLAGEDALRVAAAARAERPALQAVVIALRSEACTLLRMERLRLEVLVDLGSESIEALDEALAAVQQGRANLSRRRLAARHAALSPGHAAAGQLTDCRCQVLALIGHGLDDAEIGRRVGACRSTVKWHRSELLHHFGLATSPQLVAFSQVEGFARMAVSS